MASGMRRVWVLISELPPESRTWRKGNWSKQDELLAIVAETIDHWGLTYLQTRGVKLHELPKPLEITHPDRDNNKPGEGGSTLSAWTSGQS